MGGLKVCCFCKIAKVKSEFNINNSKISGLQDDCRICKTIRARLNYKKDSKKRLAASQKWREANRIKARGASRNWANKNKQRVLANRTAYCIKNKEKIKAKKDKWVKENYGWKLNSNAERRALKLNATPKWLTMLHKNEILEFYTNSIELRWLSEEPLHVDHIIPLKGVEVCGLHVPWNLQILPRSLNLTKNNKLPEEVK